MRPTRNTPIHNNTEQTPVTVLSIRYEEHCDVEFPNTSLGGKQRAGGEGERERECVRDIQRQIMLFDNKHEQGVDRIAYYADSHPRRSLLACLFSLPLKVF